MAWWSPRSPRKSADGKRVVSNANRWLVTAKQEVTVEDQQSASVIGHPGANGESTDTASAAHRGHREGEIDAAGERIERGAVADSQADGG